MATSVKAYKDYDQQELDLQYNVRAGIADYESIFRRWKESSRRTVEQFADRLHADISYGRDPLQTIDLFLASKRGRPLVLFIHGGYWQSLDKTSFNYLADAFLSEDYNFATINYRLAPAATMDEMVSDCREAVAYLAKSHERFGFDPEKIIVTGSSAGGHLTAMMLATDWGAYGLRENFLAGGCALSGLYDLEPIRRCYLNDVVGLDAEMARRNSPVHIAPKQAPPLILAFGGDETEEFRAQEEALVLAWRANALPHIVIPQSDGHHFDMVDRLREKDGQIFKAIKSILK